jgi:putative ABC transport system permease protein
VAGLWFLEHLVPAVPAAFAGWALARVLVERFGPPGPVTEVSLRPALVAAGIAALAGPVTVAAVAAVSAARRVRPAVPVSPRRARPWGLLVIVAAAVAGIGMWSTTQARGVDLLVPMLVFAAAGVLGGTLVVRLASLTIFPPKNAATTTDRRPMVVGWLLRRRLAAGGERVLTVVLLATGLGMLVFTVSAVDTVRVNIDDRVATSAGAAAVATIPGSWLLDDQAVAQPPEPRPEDGPAPEGPVPGVRTPPLPAHAALVWRLDATTPYDEGLRDLVVVEPESFLRVAEWGRGADLAAARAALRRLASVDASGSKVPAIVVGDPSLARVDDVPVNLGGWNGQMLVIAKLPAFPGFGNRAMYVVPGAAMFRHLGRDDPRLRPTGGAPTFARTELWSSTGQRGIDEVVAPRSVDADLVSTIDQYRQDADYVAARQSRGYELAVAAYLALLAIVALALHADRTAVAARPGDLMLARIGVGRVKVVGARVAELGALVVVALACAVGGLAVLRPMAARLLDPVPDQVPVLRFGVPAPAVAGTLAVAVVAALLAVLLAIVRSSAREEEAFRGDG